MKIKFFYLLVLLMGIGVISYAQTESAAPADQKDAPVQAVSPEPAKTAECPGHQTMAAKTDCKWVDANNDGICDTCKKTEKECMEKCKGESAKGYDPAACTGHNDSAKSTGCCSSKGGKKSE